MTVRRTARLGFRQMAGFTIFELMIAIGIAAVIAGIAVPNFRQFILNSRITSSANDLNVALTTARAQAIKTRTQTIACFSAAPGTTVPVCDGTALQGWVVFNDANANGVADAGESVVLRHDAMPSTLNVRTQPSPNDGYLAFSPSGFRKAIGTKVALTAVIVCDSRGNVATYGANNSTARAINVSPTGRSGVTRVVADITTAGGCP